MKLEDIVLGKDTATQITKWFKEFKSIWVWVRFKVGDQEYWELRTAYSNVGLDRGDKEVCDIRIYPAWTAEELMHMLPEDVIIGPKHYGLEVVKMVTSDTKENVFFVNYVLHKEQLEEFLVSSKRLADALGQAMIKLLGEKYFKLEDIKMPK